MWVGHDAGNAHDFILGLVGRIIAGVDDTIHELAFDTLSTTISAHETPDGVVSTRPPG